jgi:hypothetical protein
MGIILRGSEKSDTMWIRYPPAMWIFTGAYQIERKTPDFSHGDISESLFGAGEGGNPLPKPNHLTLTQVSGTLVPVSRGRRASHVPQGLRELRSVEDV